MSPTWACDLVAGDLLPGRDPLDERRQRRERVGRLLEVPAAAGEVVDDGDLMAAVAEPQRRRPAEIAVAPENEDAHRRGRLSDTGPATIGPEEPVRAHSIHAAVRITRVALAAICVLALVLRIAEAVDGGEQPPDATAYAQLAENLSEDGAYGFDPADPPTPPQPAIDLLPGPAPPRRRRLHPCAARTRRWRGSCWR